MTTSPTQDEATMSLAGQLKAFRISTSEFTFVSPQTIVAATTQEAKEQKDKETASSLTTRLQNLPPELFNQIYQLTFSASAGVRKIDRTTKPSHLLNVSHNSRNTFAESYYGNETFEINMYAAKRWIESLPPARASQIKHIRMSGYTFYLSSTEILAFMRTLRRLSDFYFQLQLDQLQLNNAGLNVPELFKWEVSMSAGGKCCRRWIDIYDVAALSEGAYNAHTDGGNEAFEEAMVAYVKRNCDRED